MGQEIQCTLRFKGKTSKGKALLESGEILFRGDISLRFPFADIENMEAKNGNLHFRTKEGLAVLDLGQKAEKWQDKVLHPKSRIQKLGPKPGDASVIVGAMSPEFIEELRDNDVAITAGKVTGAPNWIFLSVEKPAHLNKVKTIRDSMGSAAGLWIIYPKGVKVITERDVRESGLEAGLVDVKVASFSETHTALKFVIPKAKR
jgi:hypothetical protein